MRPLVSIIVTSYNYAVYLRQTIDSALEQTYGRVEVVVVDDGSTDSSPEIIRGYGEKIRAIFQANGGGTASMNAGFAASRGDIVMFLDSDDALRPDAAETVVAVWRQGITAVQFRLETIDEAGRPLGGMIPNFRRGRTPEQVRREALRSGLYAISPTSGNAYCRAFLQRFMPLSTAMFPYGPDGPINAVAPLYGDVVTIDRPLGYYRIHGRNFYAQKAIRPEMFAGYVLQDQRRVAFFCEHARNLGVRLPASHALIDRAFYHLQYRLASLMLSPERHPVPRDTRAGLLWRGVRASFVSRDHPAMRLCALLWMACVAAAPRPLALRLVALRFVGGHRPPVLNKALKALRVINAAKTNLTTSSAAWNGGLLLSAAAAMCG